MVPPPNPSPGTSMLVITGAGLGSQAANPPTSPKSTMRPVSRRRTCRACDEARGWRMYPPDVLRLPRFCDRLSANSMSAAGSTEEARWSASADQGVAGEAEDPLADLVALDLRRAAGDRHAAVHQHEHVGDGGVALHEDRFG